MKIKGKANVTHIDAALIQSLLAPYIPLHKRPDEERCYRVQQPEPQPIKKSERGELQTRRWWKKQHGLI